MYRNNGDLTFDKVTQEWGFNEPINSNGAAYADLDNDGDLDVVINNIDALASLYENTSDQLADRHYLEVGFKQNMTAKPLVQRHTCSAMQMCSTRSYTPPVVTKFR